MNCLHASRQLWSAPSEVNRVDGSSYRILELEQVVLPPAANPFSFLDTEYCIRMPV
jgi:hypothetical protein